MRLQKEEGGTELVLSNLLGENKMLKMEVPRPQTIDDFDELAAYS